MDTVIVTGGRGASGRWVVDRLREDHEVVVVDRDHPGFGAEGVEDVDFRAADLTDRGAVRELVASVDPDAVVHWGAIPALGRHPEGTVFENNAIAAYNVLTAAGEAGARIVQASSDGAYGFFFADEELLPDELPVTEAHPRRPEDGYGLSKVAAEEVAAGIARRHGVQVASIRPSWIQEPGVYPCRDSDYTENLDAGAGNYWSYVDARDVATQVHAALTAEFAPDGGHEAFNCVAADNALGDPLEELLERYYGEVPEAGPGVDDDGGAYSVAKAADLLDWTPEHSWRDAADEAVPRPELVRD
ncbi:MULTISPECIES: NAD-dependent epimerase/dehydratase family protein [Halolamina]|uniref:UDP-glucose 4-epimerase n=1 Tax=Halolamina pelagica TaxID=699431 RepID=A0A1I5QE47_9EURY|nr:MULTISPECIES: NAD(P)-dependent oxidoreductase [Halolamina]NHX35207.1 NAD(P)-dependent oxidoreductase [Halolamina sp. R1-12]SFP44116.1 UDP-glucose 4-epimerase [Halolamina pelagica]